MLKRVHGSARLTSMAGRYIEKANPTSEDGKKMAEASQLSVRRVNATRALRARTPGMNLTDRFDSAQLLTGQWTSSRLELPQLDILPCCLAHHITTSSWHTTFEPI
jgi:hypothetical protein